MWIANSDPRPNSRSIANILATNAGTDGNDCPTAANANAIPNRHCRGDTDGDDCSGNAYTRSGCGNRQAQSNGDAATPTRAQRQYFVSQARERH